MAKRGGGTKTTGTVVRIVREKAFGFIKAESGQEFFFHRSAVEEFDDLQEGDTVQFIRGEGAKGPRAESVERL